MNSSFHSKDIKALLGRVVDDRMRRRGETFFYYHQEAEEMQWGTNADLTSTMKEWRKQRKQNVTHLQACNNRTVQIRGRDWYILTLQRVDGEDPICRTGFGFDSGYMISGYTYIFKHEQNRDATYKYVMGIKD
jgi:hypothetical protein